MKTIECRRAKLLAEKKAIAVRAERRHEEYRRDNKREGEIDTELHRLSIAAQLNKPAGVTLDSRIPAGQKGAQLNGRAGTLKEIARTIATVDFGDEGEWRIPVDDLRPTGTDQGEYVEATL